MQSNPKQKVAQYLREHGLRPKKHLGQNFLIAESIYQTILDHAALTPADTVIEVGPGLGTLTFELSHIAGEVIAIEKDDDLIPILRKDFADAAHTSILHGSVLDFHIRQDTDGVHLFNGVNDLTMASPTYKLIANIPYYITSPIVMQFLKAPVPPTQIILLVQKEVAEKICTEGKGGTVLSIMVQAFGTPSILRIVEPGAFVPPPKVHSALLQIIPHDAPRITSDPKHFEKTIKMGFSHKRKKLAHNIHAGLHMAKEAAREMLDHANIDRDIRPEFLTVEEWDRLTKNIYKEKK